MVLHIPEHLNLKCIILFREENKMLSTNYLTPEKYLTNDDLIKLPSFRNGTILDLDKIIAVNAQLEFDNWDRARFEQAFEFELPIKVISLGGKIIGYLVYLFCLDEARIINFHIDKNYQGLGFGRRLLNFVLAQLKTQDVDYVLLDVRKNNHPAIKLYTSIGFESLCSLVC